MERTLAPAILKDNFEEIFLNVGTVAPHVSLVQIDIIDGVFSPNTTWPYPDIEEVIHSRKALDTLSVPYELDLMVQKPEVTLPVWESTNAVRLIFHMRSTDQLEKCLFESKRAKKKSVVAVGAGDDIKKLKPLAKYIDGIQCMGISEVGFQGQPFDSEVFDRIETVRKVLPKADISVDGAVSFDNIESLKKAGVTRFVMGSAIFSGDVVENIRRAKELIN